MKNNINNGKMTVIGVGGTGINIAVDSYSKLKLLPEGFSKLDIKLLDSTDKTIQAHEDYRSSFTKITSNRASSDLDGTGGEKKDLGIVKDIGVFMKSYIDTAKLSNNKNDFYVIISSASGGTGGNGAAILLKLMLDKGYNVIVVSIGDGSSLLYLNNTINSLSSLQQVALRSNTALSVIYYSNTIDNVSTLNNEKLVNEKVYKMLSIISVFISGSIHNIDMQDMINFFKPSNYTTFNVNPGIYQIGVSKGVLTDTESLLSRTILKSEKDEFSISIPLFSNKTGIIPESISDNFDDYPISLLFRKNVLHKEVIELKKDLEKLKHLEEIEYDAFDNIDNSVTDEDDEFGLAL